MSSIDFDKIKPGALKRQLKVAQDYTFKLKDLDKMAKTPNGQSVMFEGKSIKMTPLLKRRVVFAKNSKRFASKNKGKKNPKNPIDVGRGEEQATSQQILAATDAAARNGEVNFSKIDGTVRTIPHRGTREFYMRQQGISEEQKHHFFEINASGGPGGDATHLAYLPPNPRRVPEGQKKSTISKALKAKIQKAKEKGRLPVRPKGPEKFVTKPTAQEEAQIKKAVKSLKEEREARAAIDRARAQDRARASLYGGDEGIEDDVPGPPPARTQDRGLDVSFDPSFRPPGRGDTRFPEQYLTNAEHIAILRYFAQGGPGIN
jgi:hypothetical protein